MRFINKIREFLHKIENPVRTEEEKNKIEDQEVAAHECFSKLKRFSP